MEQISYSLNLKQRNKQLIYNNNLIFQLVIPTLMFIFI